MVIRDGPPEKRASEPKGLKEVRERAVCTLQQELWEPKERLVQKRAEGKQEAAGLKRNGGAAVATQVRGVTRRQEVTL